MSNFCELIKRNVCRIKNGENEGTGFLISDNRILTAKHCVAQAPKEKIILEFLNLCDKTICREAFLEDSSDTPIAVLKFDRPLILKYPTLSKMTLKEDYDFQTFGYPVLSRGSGRWISGTINRVLTNNNVRPYDWNIALEDTSKFSDFHGLSGSPFIIDETIVGIIMAQSTDSSAKAVSIGAADFSIYEQYLSKNNICLSVKKKEIKKSGNSPKVTNKFNISNFGNNSSGNVINFGDENTTIINND